ncbi:hypothetical protein CCP4SC76_3690004 [Gammaproteobacteria bacterium]
MGDYSATLLANVLTMMGIEMSPEDDWEGTVLQAENGRVVGIHLNHARQTLDIICPVSEAAVTEKNLKAALQENFTGTRLEGAMFALNPEGDCLVLCRRLSIQAPDARQIVSSIQGISEAATQWRDFMKSEADETRVPEFMGHLGIKV